MPAKAEPENPIVKRLPTCPENHRESIDEFLHYFRDRVERALNDLRGASMTDKSPRTVGQISYHRTQLSVLNWLISMNQQRRKVARPDAD